MINKKLAILSLFFLPLFGMAQGMEFDHISLDEALKKAKEESKLVFIDFYTEWCAPCKKMEKNIFPLPDVGQVYNKNFVNLKLDAEKEGKAIASQYNVTGYPTLLYLDTDGKVLLRDMAYTPKEDFIASAHRAIESVNSEYSLKNLKKLYPTKLKDEEFLKIYIKKMEQYGQDVAPAIDAWLRVQTEMEEDSPEMKDYILKNARKLFIGGKGHEILKDNLDSYLKIASDFEARMLPRLHRVILNNTRELALDRKDPELMLAFINAYKQLPESRRDTGKLFEAQLSYYNLLDDDNSFKELTETYIDSIISLKSISEIKEEDNRIYQMRRKSLEEDNSPYAKRMLIAYKNGFNAGRLVKDLSEKAHGYLDRIDQKSEYKTLEKWIEYGYRLDARKFYIDNLLADMYYKKGKTNKAITLKKQAVKNWPEHDKKYVSRVYELDQMENEKK